ncbi:MAG TPA: proton-conducting transporter membrane subunit, partial [Acidimicrobiia bacterium]
AGMLTLFLLAQAGVPFTGGFIAKLTIFRAAVDAGQYQLALVGMLAAVVGAYVYLRLVLAMYAPVEGVEVAETTADDADRPRIDWGSGLALTIAGAGVLVIGIIPSWFISVAHQATQLLAAR